MLCCSLLKQQWADILGRAEQVTIKVNGLQEGFKEDLLKNITIFKNNVKNFRADYESNGPGVEGIQPAEAYHLLARFQSEFETLHHTHEVYRGGEKLFGLPESLYPELVKTKKELSDLDNLYRLYRVRFEPAFLSAFSLKISDSLHVFFCGCAGGVGDFG